MQREVVAAAMVVQRMLERDAARQQGGAHHIPAPACVTVCQFVCCAAFVSVAKACGRVEVEVLQWSRLRHFVLYVASFVMGTYSNMRALASTNVETVIVARCCSPLAVVGIDYIAYGREAPTTRSSCALMLVAIGAATYVWVDRGFRAHGLLAYRWVAVWWTTTVFQLTYGKFLVTHIGLQSLWTAVSNTNACATLPAPRDCVLDRGGRDGVGGRVLVARGDRGWLAASCGVGIGISWSGFQCQKLMSATSYTVLGVANKVAVVAASALLLGGGVSPAGLCALMACLVGCSLYRPAPLRIRRRGRRWWGRTHGMRRPPRERASGTYCTSPYISTCLMLRYSPVVPKYMYALELVVTNGV